MNGKSGQEASGTVFWGMLRSLGRWYDRPARWLQAPAGRRLLAGSAMMATVLAVAQAQQNAPAHWIAYARMTVEALQTRLNEGMDERISRLHEWLKARQGRRITPLPVVVRIWISPEGQIVRGEFESLGDREADADLRALLLSHPALEAPPADMRQPLILQLTLRPNPDYKPPVPDHRLREFAL
jgi:hypothetical protein